MNLNGKRVDLRRLKAEATAAGVVVGDLEIAGGDELVTIDGDGHTVPDLPAGMVAVLAAHTAPPLPIEYGGQDEISYIVRTVGTTSAELLRLSMTIQTGYAATVEVIGIDAGNGVMKRLLFASTFKRLNGGALSVAAKTDLVSHQDSGAPATTAGVANWTIVPSLDGNDAIVTVTGHTGRTVDWFAFVTMRRFRPGGL